MKNLLLAVFLSASTLMTSVMPAVASYSDPLPNASCEGGLLKIYMRDQGASGKIALRIDDLSNPWTPEKMQKGDFITDSFTSSAYSGDMQVSHEYSWWFHTIDSKGKYSEAKSGRTYCRPSNPKGIRASYEAPYVVLRWSETPGAVKYAIRVDNQINPWTPDNMQEGDHVLNSVTETEFRFKASPNRKITWWVHAVDKYGVYSDPSVAPIFETN